MSAISLRGPSGPNRSNRGQTEPGRGPRPERPSRDPRKNPAGPRPPREAQRPPRQRSGGGDKPGGRGSRRGGETPFTIKGELLFGRNAILESLGAERRKPTRLWVAEGLREDERIDQIMELARASEVLIETVPRTMLDDQLPEVNHQGVLLESGNYPYADLADVIDREGTVLVLDHLQDPQNFGTLLRSAEAAGVAGVIIPTDRSAEISPTVVNASSGAVEHLAIATVPNLGNALEKLEASGRWIVGLDGGPGSQDLFTTDVPTPAVLVVGSEGPGLTANIRKRCQLIVSLPMRGQVESLNAATAGSIVLFDLMRREQADPDGD